MAKTPLTNAEKALKDIKSALLGIAPYVGGNSRQELAVKMNCSLRTIDRYFAGEVAKLPFGIQLVREARKFTGTNV